MQIVKVDDIEVKQVRNENNQLEGEHKPGSLYGNDYNLPLLKNKEALNRTKKQEHTFDAFTKKTQQDCEMEESLSIGNFLNSEGVVKDKVEKNEYEIAKSEPSVYEQDNKIKSECSIYEEYNRRHAGPILKKEKETTGRCCTIF